MKIKWIAFLTLVAAVVIAETGVIQFDTGTGAVDAKSLVWSGTNTFTGPQAFDQLTVTNATLRGTLNTGGNWISGDGGAEGISVDSSGQTEFRFVDGATFARLQTIGGGLYFLRYSDTASIAPQQIWVRARGSYPSYAGIQANDVICYLGGTAYSNTVGSIPTMRVGITMYASETWSATQNGTYLIISTTANGAVGRSERLRVTAAGDLLIQNTTGTNILSVKQTSTTDPIADSWLTYTCTRDEKAEVEPELNTGYLGRLAAWKTYRYQRLPIVRDDEVKMVTDGIMQARREDAEKTKAIVKPITSKEQDDIRVSLSAAKAAAPKFKAVKVGPMIDDAETPREIFADGQNYHSGIDLLGYIGFLHAALREEVQAREALEKRLAKLEEVIKP